jgi:NAD(P)-dependent dehydrogenase (short-subunit alcohol dehydrogenase family)
MAGRLANKRALVYGGGTGIGFACAQAMAEEGAAVFLSGRRQGVLRDSVAKLTAQGFKAGQAAGDATKVEDVQRVTADAVRFLGGLDTLVVSAGAGGRTSVFDTEPEEFQRIMDNTLRPVFLAVRYGVSHLLAAGQASVILISSTFGLVGVRERLAYCGAKAGVIGMAKAMAMDLADRGVRVNAICPGFVETELPLSVAAKEPDPEAWLQSRRTMHPIPRSGTLPEMGELAVYLASDLAAFVTGQAIAIDGGFSTR